MQSLPRRRRIYLMRHGDVRYFNEGRPVPPDGVVLTAEGRAQAEAAAKALADVSFEAAFSTGLPRTVETAAIVLGDRPLAVGTVPDLQEIHPGTAEDMAGQDLRAVFVEAFTQPLTADNRFLMGERYGDFRARVLPAFRSLLSDQTWSNLLLVAHGATNRVIIADLLGAELDAIGHIEQDPACINVIDVDDQGYGIVRLLNYTPYNPLKTGLSLTTMERYFVAAQRGE